MKMRRRELEIREREQSMREKEQSIRKRELEGILKRDGGYFGAGAAAKQATAFPLPK